MLSSGLLLGTFATLICLTFITVAVARTDLGKLNIVIAMAIASVKAALVASIFMHLKYEKKINAVVLVTALIFALVLAGFVLFDTTQYQGDVKWGTPGAPPAAHSGAHSAPGSAAIAPAPPSAQIPAPPPPPGGATPAPPPAAHH